MNDKKKPLTFQESITKSFNTGLAGSLAMCVQVTSLMWLRTTMNYQYRYGKTTKEAFQHLYNEGGLRRFYRGYAPALLVAPLSRFGDTMTNTYALQSLENTNLPTSIKTMAGSFLASSWRVFMMPIDTFKTTLQVEGKPGMKLLKNKINNNGVKILFNGTIASTSATFVGHYPWFLTYNVLNQKIPNYEDDKLKTLMRNGFIGFNSAVISDCCSNSLRVIKTTKQTSSKNINYQDTVQMIIKEDGVKGLLGRGLKTRILTNGLQGIIFTICWKYIEKTFFTK
tara:strand:- start:45 stop:890 length:846 start_codon:yes stop_codon:yes gene_type:complete